METAEKIARLQDSLSKQFLEREEIVEGAILALGTAQHVLFVGPPGTAKSAFVNALTASIKGARCFSLLLSKFSKPEEVFGPISLKALENDEYRRVTAGKLPEAEIAFLDEVFKASTAILNSLLTLVNERIFHNDGAPMRCPLISLFGASNELPEGDEEAHLAAFADRFLFRYQVGYLSEDAHFAQLLQLPDAQPSGAQVDLSDIAAYQALVSQVALGQDAVEALVTLRSVLAKEGITASDRRWRQAVSALKAKAVLAGSSRLEVQRDFDVLLHILWSDPGQKRTVAKVVRKVADPLAEQVLEILEEAREIYDNAVASGKTEAGSEAVSKFKALLKSLDAVESQLAPGSRVRAQNARDKITAWNREVLEKCLGIRL